MKFYKNKNKVPHFIRINEQLIFGMGNSPLSGTSVVKLGSHKLKLVYNIVISPNNTIILGHTKKKCKSLGCLQHKA